MHFFVVRYLAEPLKAMASPIKTEDKAPKHEPLDSASFEEEQAALSCVSNWSCSRMLAASLGSHAFCLTRKERS